MWMDSDVHLRRILYKHFLRGRSCFLSKGGKVCKADNLQASKETSAKL